MPVFALWTISKCENNMFGVSKGRFKLTERHGLPEGKSIKIQFQWLGVMICSRKWWTEATANCWHVRKTHKMRSGRLEHMVTSVCTVDRRNE